MTRKTLEISLILTGLALLGAYGVIKGWSFNESQSGISAFEDAKAGMLAVPEQTPVAVSAVGDPFAEIDPDYSTWSDNRIQEYQESLTSNDEKPLALLSIEHLDIRVPVFDGESDLNLNRGVARITGTGQVGRVGNIGIAGHRDGFFRPLKDIKVGDDMVFETLWGTTEYVVSSITIVEPSDVSVLAASDSAALTLVTCYPFYFVGNAPKRFIVRAEAKPTRASS